MLLIKLWTLSLLQNFLILFPSNVTNQNENRVTFLSFYRLQLLL